MSYTSISLSLLLSFSSGLLYGADTTANTTAAITSDSTVSEPWLVFKACLVMHKENDLQLVAMPIAGMNSSWSYEELKNGIIQSFNDEDLSIHIPRGEREITINNPTSPLYGAKLYAKPALEKINENLYRLEAIVLVFAKSTKTQQWEVSNKQRQAIYDKLQTLKLETSCPSTQTNE